MPCGRSGPTGSGGFPAAPSDPLLKGRKRVAVPARRVVMRTDSVSTAKCTSARRLKFEDRLALIAVLPVLPASIVGPLARERVLQLRRDDGNPVQTERDIYGEFSEPGE